MTGSILVGSTTGFYTFDPKLEKDTLITFISRDSIENFIVNVYPNPFADEATVRLTLSGNEDVQIDLYDLIGKKVLKVFYGKGNKGSSNYIISPDQLSSGSYLVFVNVNGTISKRLLYYAK